MRRINWKKPAAVAAALALSTALLAGCGSTAASSDSVAESTAVSESTAEEAEEGDADEVAAKNCADLIDAIYVQERTDDTDAQCEAAKAAWDALTDTQKEMVEGENADPEYFGRDTGDASKDAPRNEDEIGENELLVVSFGTSFNGSRAADIKGIEDALQAANPDWSVRREDRQHEAGPRPRCCQRCQEPSRPAHPFDARRRVRRDVRSHRRIQG